MPIITVASPIDAIASTPAIHANAVNSPNSDDAGQNTFWQITNSATSAVAAQPNLAPKDSARSWMWPLVFSAMNAEPWTRNSTTSITPPSSANGLNSDQNDAVTCSPSLARPMTKLAKPTPNTSEGRNEPTVANQSSMLR